MKISLRWVRKWHLVLGTALYWAGLAWLKLLEPVTTAWRLVHLPDGHGSINAGFTNTLLQITMREGGTVVWSGSAYLVTILAWIVGPPLVAFLAWRGGREAASSVAEESAAAESTAPGLRSEATQRILPTPPLPDLSASSENREPMPQHRSDPGRRR